MYHPVFCNEAKKIIIYILSTDNNSNGFTWWRKLRWRKGLGWYVPHKIPIWEYAKTDEGGALAVGINPNQDHYLPDIMNHSIIQLCFLCTPFPIWHNIFPLFFQTSHCLKNKKSWSLEIEVKVKFTTKPRFHKTPEVLEIILTSLKMFL